MLGMRRFLGGGISPVDPPPDKQSMASSTSSLPPPANAEGEALQPATDASGRQPNWPPRSSSPTKAAQPPLPIPPPLAQLASPPASPGTTKAGIFHKARSRSRTRRTVEDSGEDDGSVSSMPLTRRSSSRSRGRGSTGHKSPEPMPMSPPSRVLSPLSAPSSPRNGRFMTAVAKPPLPRRPETPPYMSNGGPSPTRVTADLSPSQWKHSPSLLDTSDEMLMSLLASQAVVDSRDFQILSSEEADELKAEQQILNTRLKALRQKLSTEIKIRNAAESLAKLHANHKRMSRQTNDQLDTAVRKVEAAEKEVAKVADRAAEIGRKLDEHRAGVLSFSLTLLERRLGINAFGAIDGMEDESSIADSGTVFSDDRSPPSTAATSTSGTSRAAPRSKKFTGPHLFAGNADAIIPSLARHPPTPAAVAQLEDRLKAANEAIEALRKAEREALDRVERVNSEKTDVETMLSMQLNVVQENALAMEQELSRLDGMEQMLKDLEKEKEEWKRERRSLESRTGELEGELRKARFSKAKDPETERLLKDTADTLKHKQEDWEAERKAWEDERRKWAAERAKWQGERDDLEARAQVMEARAVGLREDATGLRQQMSDSSKRLEELEPVQRRVADLVRAHVTDAADLGDPVAALSKHFDSVRAQKETHAYQLASWENDRRRMQEEIVEVRVRLGREIEEAKKEVEKTKGEVQSAVRQSRAMSPNSVSSEDSATLTDLRKEHVRVMNLLQEVWNILPSAEARAGKMGRSKTPTTSPVTRAAPDTSGSLSDMDVRALKMLYDPKSGFSSSSSSPQVPDSFSVEVLVKRIKALVADDRALMERLIRFAQAHDLLKANAERSQRLAQEGRVGMETYQKQVKQLEERIAGTVSREAGLVAEITDLHRVLEEARATKRGLEEQLMKHTEKYQSLSDANKVLSARNSALAAEAADAPQAARSKVEAQVGELKRALQEAQDEVESLRNIESSQRMRLMDELNTVQKENAALRDQLRRVAK